MKNQFVLILVSLLMLGGVMSCSSQKQASQIKDEARPQPNVIILLADDLGWQDVKCYDIDEPSFYETPNIDALAKYAFGDNVVTKRLKMYEKYLQMRDQKYLDWAIENVILWRRTESDSEVIHIHGDADAVFPIRHIKNSIVIKGATHTLVIMKYKWLNENLPKLILNKDEDESKS